MAHEPFVNVRIYEGQGTEEKGDIARRVTRAICDATKLPAGAVWVVVEDVETHPAFHDAQLQAVMRAAGVRAVQSTPLIDRNGTVFGMLSTHFRTPHQPTEHELHLIDVFARLLADVHRTRVEASAQRGT